MWFRFSVHSLLAVALIEFCFASGPKRHIRCDVYSDDLNTTFESSLSVMHVSATSDNDVVHYLWSSYNLPSVIVTRTTKDTILNIDIKKLRLFQKDAITFSTEPLASTGFTITELWQNSYSSDTSDVNEITSVTPLNLESFKWKNITHSHISCSDQFGQVTLVSSSEDEIFAKGGTFEVELSVAGIEKPASDYPHLIYTGNSTQIKAVFNNFHSNSSRVRYAMEMSMFAPVLEKCSHKDCETVITKSVSDEFSPGIFSDIALLPPCSQDSFLSWRPVAYISRTPNVANSTDAKVTSDCSKTIISSPRSIAELFFNDKAKFSVSAFNMTFGTKGDGFYPKTEYTMWSFMAGVGKSVGFKVSLTAIITGSIGVGALLLFIICGLTFIGVQKFWRRNDADQTELLSENTSSTIN